MLRRFLTRALTLLALASTPLAAQVTDSSLLSVDRIFNDGTLSPAPFPRFVWAADGKSYYSFEPRPGGKGSDLVKVDPVSLAKRVVVKRERLVPAGDTVPLQPSRFAFSADGRKLLIYTNTARVWRQNTRGDYWVLDLATSALHKLGGDMAKPQTLMFAKFAPQGDRVAYVRSNNLYVESLSDQRITALTNDGSVTTINGTFDWVYEEEFDDRDGFRWSPDGSRIAYWQLDASGVRDFLLINDTDSLYSFTKPVQYPKAGTTNSAVRIGTVSAAGGDTRWMQLPGDPRNVYVARMEWAANSSQVVMQHLNRLQNTLTVLVGTALTGTVEPILVEKDSAWVDVVDDWTWFDRGSRFLWISERDGWRHAYSVSRDGKDVRLLTPGAYDIANVVSIDTLGGSLYFRASPNNPTQRYLFRVPLRGGVATRLSPDSQTGTHYYTASPDSRYAVHVHSSLTRPPVSELIKLPSHAVVRTLSENTALRARVATLRRGATRFVRVDAGNGTTLDGVVLYPADFDSTKHYPVLFNVYGEPAGQTAVDDWYALDLWHLMLTQQGYAVITLDNRGTPSLRGRDWRKSIYRKIGVLATDDQAGAARAIGRWSWVDSTRMGIWGWSGGGSMTLNLMFRTPGVYATGMSVAPVPDVHLYDTIYQERYMGLPSENEADYQRSSPLTFASQLRGNLLIVHGSGDDNVHYQGTERLVNALVAANKQFQMMVYPNRSHGIFEGEGTSVHLTSLLTQYLKDHLPAGGRLRANSAPTLK